MSRSSAFVTSLAAVLALGCSAIINPDPGRLGGGEDAGEGTMDGGNIDGGNIDGGPIDDGGPIGDDAGPSCPDGCDDEIACTVDRCVDGACIHTPNESLCGDEERCAPTIGCVPNRCSTDAECDDGRFCTGVERCDPASGDPDTGCVPGTPVTCDDGASCTTDACDEATDRCLFAPNDAVCGDGVECTVDSCNPSIGDDATGCTHDEDHAACATDYCVVGRTCNAVGGCGGGSPRDCLDGDPCTEDHCNETADRCDHPLRDDDMDGHHPISARLSGGPVVSCGGDDCDDSDPARHPGAPEACNGIDDDCDTRVDEGCPPSLPDTCATAQAIALDSSGRGSVTGTLGSFGDDFQTNAVCGAGTGGRDAVYYIDLPAGRHDVTIDTIGSAADTVLAVGLTCSTSGFQAACNDDYDAPSVTRQSRIWLHDVGSAFSATRVFILVDGYDSGETGGFVLNVNRDAAGADTCPTGTGGSLPLEITGGGTVVGFITDFTGAQRGTCQASWDTNPESIFRVRGPSSGNMEFDVYSIEFTPTVYLRRAPCGSGSERDCDVGASIGGGISQASIRESVSSGDLYYFFVDGGRGSYAIYYQPY